MPTLLDMKRHYYIWKEGNENREGRKSGRGGGNNEEEKEKGKDE